jgi:hypothetical protein
MRFALLCLLIFAQNLAHAESYSRINSVNEICSSDGDIAKIAYEKKVEGSDFVKVLIKTRDAEPDKNKRKSLGDMIDVAIMVRDKEFNSPQSAYMAAWSKCMDKYKK